MMVEISDSIDYRMTKRQDSPDNSLTSNPLLPKMAAAVVMSMTPFIYGTTLSFGGLVLAESQSADSARLSIADAVMIAAASNFGRMAGE